MKKRRQPRIFFTRLANKLIIIFTLFLSLFGVILNFLSYHRTNAILINDFIRTNKSILALVNKNFQNYITQIDELSIQVRKDAQFMQALMADDWTPMEKTYFENQLKMVFYSRNDLEELRFYIPRRKITYSISRSNDKLRAIPEQNMEEEDWYQQTISGEFFRYIEPLIEADIPQKGKFKSVFTFHRALVSIPGLRPLGVISLTFNQTIMEQLINNTYQDVEAVRIYDPKHQLFLAFNPLSEHMPSLAELVQKHEKTSEHGYFEIKIDHSDYLVVFHHQHNWKIVKLIPLAILREQVRATRNLGLLISSAFLGLFVILIIFVSHKITSPLCLLSKQMDEVGEGNFTSKVKISGSYEIKRLAERFNSMVEQVNQLINEKYKAQLNEETARLKALKAQINPHFLYNCLQAISTKAILSGITEITEMVEAFAYIMRYCIKGGDKVKISEEIKHIKKYLLLQTARYEEKLSINIQVDKGLSAFLIPKLSIQTLVENAVQHALEQMTETLTIQIHAFQNHERLVIKVTDNGPGMTPARLKEVNTEMRQNACSDRMETSIGLKNLYSRLKLMYGEMADLILRSTQGDKTEVSIVLPLNSGGEKNI